MTHHRFVTRAVSSSIHDNEEELLKDKKLILLLECVKYCTKYEIDRIRYIQLKRLSNEKLSALTHGKDVDLGGSFEKFIVKFESTDDPANRLLERQKIKHKESYIIPNIQRVRNYFAKRNLLNLIDDNSTSFKAVEFRKYKDEKYSSFLVMGEIPEDKNKTPIVRERKLYSVCYYYENGNPVFVDDYNGWEKDPAPFYQEDSNTSAFKATGHMHLAKDMVVSPVLVTDPWSVHLVQPRQKNVLVTEDDLKQLIAVGKNIVSCNPGFSLGMAIQYNASNKS